MMNEEDGERLTSPNHLVVVQDDVFVAPVQPVNIRTATVEDVVLMRKQMARDLEYMYGQRVPQFFTIRHVTSMCLIVQLLCFIVLFFVALFVLGRHHTDPGVAFGIGFIPFPVSCAVALGLHYYYQLPRTQTAYNIFTGFVTTLVVMVIVIYFGNTDYQDYHLNQILAVDSSQVAVGCNTTIARSAHFLTVALPELWSVPAFSKPIIAGINQNIYSAVDGDVAYCAAPIAFQGVTCSDLFAICATPASTPCSTPGLQICGWDLKPTEFFLNEDNAFGDRENQFDSAILTAHDDVSTFQIVWRGAERTYFQRLLIQLHRESTWGSILMFIFFIVVVQAESVFSKWLWPIQRLHTIRRWQNFVAGNTEMTSQPTQPIPPTT
jgi:hypothetical protein